MLNRAFNRMTGQIEQQTAALVGANRQLEERRAFIEAVIAIDLGRDRHRSTVRAAVLLMNSFGAGTAARREGPGARRRVDRRRSRRELAAMVEARLDQRDRQLVARAASC